MRGLQHIKFIDKRYSTYDEKKSSPKEGKYLWTEKANVTYKDSSRRPDYVVKWVRNHPDTLNEWIFGVDQFSGGWRYVELDDYIVPEMCNIDENKHWIHADVVLMKLPLGDYLERQKGKRQKADKAAKQTLRTFNRQVPKEARMSEEEILRALG